MNQQLRDAYWALVRECLIRFHGLSAAEADRRMEDFLQYMRDAPEGIDTDIVFTCEAFERACELAEHELDPRSLWGEYMAMMDRHYADIPIPQAPKGSAISPELKDAYWSILRECLTRFHGFSEGEAVRRVESYVEYLDKAPADLPMDIVFNAEPFEVANDLAGHEVDWDTHRVEYLAIMDRAYAAMPLPDSERERPPRFLPAG